MAKRKLIHKLIRKENILEELRFIEESECSYITSDGKVYTDYGDGMMFPLKTYINKNNGYVYVGFKGANGKMIQRRVHILVAKCYVPNPNNYPCVCHKDDDKSNPKSDNLEWNTHSFNTKSAYMHGLIKKYKSWDDSQSVNVCCFDLNMKLVKIYGSIGEASRELKITKTGIIYQCEHKMVSKPRKGYYFRYLSEFNKKGFVL